MSAPEEQDDELRQAPDELARDWIGAVTLASLAVVGVSLLIAWMLLGRWGEVPSHETPPPAPRTIATLEQSLILHTDRGLELRTQQAALLARREWVDRDAGIARIAIDDAIDVFVASPPAPDRPLFDGGEADGK